MKGEAQVFPKLQKSFDPTLIPGAIKDAGFTAVEVVVIVDGTLARKEGQLQLDVAGLRHPFLLAGGPQANALGEHPDLIGRTVQVAGKLQTRQAGPSATLTVEAFKPGH